MRVTPTRARVHTPVLSTTLVMCLDAFACSMECAINGFPAMFRMFLWGTDFEPDLAGMMARISSLLCFFSWGSDMVARDDANSRETRRANVGHKCSMAVVKTKSKE